MTAPTTRRVTPTAYRVLPADADGWISLVPLTQGKVALIDPVDYPAVSRFSWCVLREPRTTYARRGGHRAGRGFTQLMHTLLTGWPEVDHVNGDGLDNRRANLRPATRAQNNANRRGWSASGLKGVTRDRSKWRARIRVDGKLRQLGTFRTAEEAARAYDRAARETFGNYARTNYQEES